MSSIEFQSGAALEDLEVIIQDFAAAEKQADGPIRWVLMPNTDTAKAQFIVTVPSRPILSAKVHLTAHVHRVPLKYGFSLILGGVHRIFGLDVNPGRGHLNLTDLGRTSVRSTHWQVWPNDLVTPDDRERTHLQWFREFCRKALIDFKGSYRPPPHLGGEQMRLL